ncbi:glycoside hydrolase family 10 protein [Waterburya agarophytonicola K14]|uniref:Glycoside hydrolase family 10 protein n=1 Tax=Waterburya agarophytonicola KI4 TaxID=2874699 RepID=A0A964BP12_9CYAN|nr:glycoside hydrolase family 10 protein [Waterburya agarophytonicola]MCC0175531.1 glycoside hydrolase family 10 protein [Waterburya agarophytonicola KI4]
MKKSIARSFDIFANKLVQFSQERGRVSWLIFLFILALTLVAITPFPGNSQPILNNGVEQICSKDLKTRELRGVWLTNIDSDVLFDRDRTSEAISLLAESNFNTIYPTVWNWGYTLYPSEVSKRVTGLNLDPTEGLQNRDILAEIVSEGHKKEMSVIPWFEFGFMAPADSELAQRHPQWLTSRQDGSTIWWEGDVHQRVWLNPLRPEVQEFMTDLLVEIVSNYDIDGIQLDDHFGYPAELGYDDYTVELYRGEHDGQSPPEDYQDPEWVRWRADKITAYVERLFHELKSHNPQAIISVSPNPQHFSLNSFLMDWYTWERKGLIEELIVQIYRDRNDSFIKELESPELLAAKAHIPVGIGVLSGLKGRPILWHKINKQVKIAREHEFAGISFFFYESLWNLATESPQRRQAALKRLFHHQAQRPNLSDCQFLS